MDKFQKSNDSERYALSSEPFRFNQFIVKCVPPTGRMGKVASGRSGGDR
jgi:hypothetical protein